MTELCLCVVSEGQSEQHESWLQLREEEIRSITAQRREKSEREKERERMKGGHRRCSSLDHPDSQHAHFFPSLSHTGCTVNVLNEARVNFLCEN